MWPKEARSIGRKTTFTNDDELHGRHGERERIPRPPPGAEVLMHTSVSMVREQQGQVENSKPVDWPDLCYGCTLGVEVGEIAMEKGV